MNNNLNIINNLKIPNINTDPLRYCLNNNLPNKNRYWLEFGGFKGYTLDLISLYTNHNVYGFDSFTLLKI